MTNSIKTFQTGQSVIYTCPINGWKQSGVIVGKSQNDPELWGDGYYDIEADDGSGVDVHIYVDEIKLDNLFH